MPWYGPLPNSRLRSVFLCRCSRDPASAPHHQHLSITRRCSSIATTLAIGGINLVDRRAAASSGVRTAVLPERRPDRSIAWSPPCVGEIPAARDDRFRETDTSERTTPWATKGSHVPAIPHECYATHAIPQPERARRPLRTNDWCPLTTEALEPRDRQVAPLPLSGHQMVGPQTAGVGQTRSRRARPSGARESRQSPNARLAQWRAQSPICIGNGGATWLRCADSGTAAFGARTHCRLTP